MKDMISILLVQRMVCSRVSMSTSGHPVSMHSASRYHLETRAICALVTYINLVPTIGERKGRVDKVFGVTSDTSTKRDKSTALCQHAIQLVVLRIADLSSEMDMTTPEQRKPTMV